MSPFPALVIRETSWESGCKKRRLLRLVRIVKVEEVAAAAVRLIQTLFPRPRTGQTEQSIQAGLPRQKQSTKSADLVLRDPGRGVVLGSAQSVFFRSVACENFK